MLSKHHRLSIVYYLMGTKLPPRCLIVVAFLALAACASQKPVPLPTIEKPTDKSEVAQMYAKVLDKVHKMYLDEYSVGKLALSGLAGLSKLEPGATVQRKDDRVSLQINGTSVGMVAAAPINDPYAWASAMKDLIDTGRNASTKLAEAKVEKIYQVTIDGILADLDRYTRYDGKKAGQRNRESREGFGGIGVSIINHAEGMLVDTVTSGLPASKAGVIKGDIIIKVDDMLLHRFSLQRKLRLIRGPLGKPVRVTLKRASQPKPLNFLISRTRIIPTTVFYQARPHYAYLRITSFNQDTTSELRDNVEKAVREFDGTLDGIVIDLRGNPGGLLDQAVSAADLFLQTGRISTTSGRHPDSLQLFDALEGEIAQDIPIVLLMNGASASASEVLAAALQDPGRAVLVGSNSFGKGTVQTVIRLPNEGELILTWARLHSPLGFDLSQTGVIPTLCTSGAKDITAVLKRSLGNQKPPAPAIVSKAITNNARTTADQKCPWQPQEGVDVDIAVAKRILEKIELYKHALSQSVKTAGG